MRAKKEHHSKVDAAIVAFEGQKSRLRFVEGITPKKVTKEWSVWLHSGDVFLGEIKWYAPWRRYVFYTSPGTLYDASCLFELSMFCWDQTAARKRQRQILKRLKDGFRIIAHRNVEKRVKAERGN